MKKHSIYSTPQIEEQMMSIYEEKLESWPVPYETRYVETSYGKMHIIICGQEDAPPMMLYNAGQMAGWSWITNVDAWRKEYRIYAVDTIGEPGRSKLNDINTFPSNGPEQADLQLEILDALGLDEVIIVGASNGGFIGAHVAIAYPERVNKLALLGPMGLTPNTNENIMRIIFAQMLPLKMVQDSTIHWSFGYDPDLLEQIDPGSDSF
ncbi:MAG: alpha/beta fold hydrolase [Anaerolineales bacterium]|nr:alpha/beta fold hydrolase [Anaerolineales bacterium]